MTSVIIFLTHHFFHVANKKLILLIKKYDFLLLSISRLFTVKFILCAIFFGNIRNYLLIVLLIIFVGNQKMNFVAFLCYGQ